ncbi:MAG TPA: hypothetical protein VMR41_02555 [Patescibacteria group bacterium]|nr:hypothetical protein [Patescibacteria group bacterium]
MKKDFPPISSLFNESWELFKSRLLRLLLFGMIDFGLFVFLALILGIIAVTSFIGAAGHNFPYNINWPSLYPFLFGVGGVLLALLILGAIFIGVLAITWQLLSLNEDPKISFGTIFRKGFSFFIPVLAVTLLNVLIIIGGFFVFVIPGILFAIFVSYAQYEVIFDKQRGINALRRSYTIITTHFGEIFVRILLLWGLSFVVSLIPHLFASRPAAGISGLSFIINILLSWFGLCYYFTLYKQAKQRTDLTKPFSILWIWIIAIIGWVILLLIIFFTGMGISQALQSGQLPKYFQHPTRHAPLPPYYRYHNSY